MHTIVDILQLLNNILNSEESDAALLVKEFQNIIWNDEIICNSYISSTLRELAYDFDFYEPSLELREEQKDTYYDYSRLLEIVKSTLKKIQT